LSYARNVGLVNVRVESKTGTLGRKQQKRLKSAVGEYLGIPPEQVQIRRAKHDNRKVSIELSEQDATKLLVAYKRGDSGLLDDLASADVVGVYVAETVRKGRTLERWVAEALRQIGALPVKHDIQINGYQFDIYAELKTAAFCHRMVIEVKGTARPVGIKVVTDFTQRFLLLHSRNPEIHEGVIVSAHGFTKPAREASKRHRIKLLEVADLNAMVDTDRARERSIRRIALALAQECGLVLVPAAEGDGWQFGNDASDPDPKI